MTDTLNRAPFPPPMPEAPTPQWKIEEADDGDDHTCRVVVSTPVPEDEDMEWEWEWPYIWLTLEEQLGEIVGDWDLPGGDVAEAGECWGMSDDGLTLFLYLRTEEPACIMCEVEAQRSAARDERLAYQQGTQGALL